MNTMKVLMLLAIAGHLLCGISDCLLIYTPSGKFGFGLQKKPERMREVFRTMPLRIGGAGNWAGVVMFLGLFFLL